jgi:DNA-binding CsgD family transcriptional regulator
VGTSKNFVVKITQYPRQQSVAIAEVPIHLRERIVSSCRNIGDSQSKNAIRFNLSSSTVNNGLLNYLTIFTS